MGTSYVVDRITGQVIYLNTDAPLAPGDDRNFQVAPAALGELPAVHGPGKNFYVPPSTVETLDALPPYGTGNTVATVEGLDDGVGGAVGLPVNVTTAIPSDNFTSALRAYAVDAYGSGELGQVRNSSAALENERTGVRFGALPRVVMKVGLSGGRA